MGGAFEEDVVAAVVVVNIVAAIPTLQDNFAHTHTPRPLSSSSSASSLSSSSAVSLFWEW